MEGAKTAPQFFTGKLDAAQQSDLMHRFHQHAAGPDRLIRVNRIEVDGTVRISVVNARTAISHVKGGKIVRNELYPAADVAEMVETYGLTRVGR